MEPLFKSATVGIVPQPTQMPPEPFEQEDLQRVFLDITRDYPYQQFGLAPGGGAAQLLNDPGDVVAIQPDLIQVTTRVDLSAEAVREKAATILKKVTSRLEIQAFLQCMIKIVAHVPVPEAQASAKAFVSERLMSGPDRVTELGAGFFCGGVKFRRIDEAGLREETLLIEPFVRDDNFIFISYDIGRAAPQEGFRTTDPVSGWVDDAFSFVRGETMRVLDT